MNYIVEFYKGLDTFNLILFWGIIIVVALLLIFSIILVNKNKKLKLLLENRENNTHKSFSDDIPISRNDKQNEPIKTNVVQNIFLENTNIEKTTIEKYNNTPVENKQLEKKQVLEERININDAQHHITNTIENNNIELAERNISNTFERKPNSITEISIDKASPQKTFVAEEYVMDYNQNASKKVVEKDSSQELPTTKPNINVNAPYQRNVLKEMSLSQTSPIGISSNRIGEREKIKANDLYNSFEKEPKPLNDRVENINKTIPNNDYLSRVSQKINEASSQNDLSRTAYERKQEEEAIISYNELMRRKDDLEIVDEEDAVISIKELMKRTNNQDNLYNITPKEPNDSFIDELKKFRNDL